jgi:hypothetical protein
MQSWTQNGNRTHWAVDIRPEAFAHVSDGMTNHSPRRIRWLETLYEEERKHVKRDHKRYDVLDTGTYDEAFVGNWMRRTDWTTIFSGVNRELVRLTQAPAADGSALVYGFFDSMHLQSGAEDERRIRTIGATMDRFFGRCEDTVQPYGPLNTMLVAKSSRRSPIQSPLPAALSPWYSISISRIMEKAALLLL